LYINRADEAIKVAWTVIRLKKTDRGYLVYYNPKDQTHPVRVWEEDVEAIGEVCKLFGKCKPLASGDYSHENLHRALIALTGVKEKLDHGPRYEDEDEDAQDDYVDLLTAIDDLTGIIRRIEEIE
jgi:hypothetical protein